MKGSNMDDVGFALGTGLSLLIFYTFEQMKNLAHGARNNSRYLRFSQDVASKIYPENTTSKYYRVSYDMWGRIVKIETYTSNGDHKSTARYIWKYQRIVQTEAYNSADVLQQYQTTVYKWYIFLVGFERYSADDQLINIEIGMH